ncbi:PoNe immunity protein domain-containing protein [Aquipseudomonas alcaligenes]|uniref:PoNe immunity protein domain-containing protein n=1 Tax=Aquipseudomonas alcaligenes TaxID=43263 RepID=UPI00194157A2|nr:PoNe immunity protein domain-containing protein [Pseudomonas alcaligenes]
MSTGNARRQPFATKAYFQRLISIYEEWNADIFDDLLNPIICDQYKSIDGTALCRNCCEIISAAYTEGQSPEQITPRLDTLVAAYEKDRELSIISYGSDEVCAGFGENDDYEQFLQTLSLCILLGRSELIPRLSAIFDRDNKGQDAIYETLLSFYDDSRVKTDDLLFKRPFAGLLKVIRATTPKEASKLLDKYCKDWYPAFKKAPWYDSHLSIDGEDGSYSGYWAFEAGAIAYLFNIDDSQIDHMVYPKDLVAYARSNTPKHNTPGPVHAGQPCPHTGYWFSPAQHNSRRHFTQGEIMPEFKDSPWGATIWYWSSAT